MNHTALKCLLAALCLSIACDPTVPAQRGPSEELAAPSKKDECPTCIKWSAKPPGGTNGPPWSI